MSLLSKYKLEKRIAKLERLVTERSAGGVEANLFSKRFEEVKAAVDEGQDVNQTNRRGLTPLLFAADSKDGNNSDIIEYLLTHGADLSSEFDGLNAYDLACKNSNLDAMKVILANDTQNVINSPSRSVTDRDISTLLYDKDFILLAASKERLDFDEELHYFYLIAHNRRIVSREQYEQIIDMLLDNCRYVDYSAVGIWHEMRNEFLSIIKKFADKEKILVDISDAINRYGVSANFARQLLKLCDEVVDGKLSIPWGISKFVITCRKLCEIAEDQSFMSRLLGPKFLSNLEPKDLRSLFRGAFRNEDVDTLSKLVAAKVKLPAAEVCDYICDYVRHTNEKVTRLAIRLIDRNTQLSSKALTSVAKYSNEYLIQYVIDMGYGELLLAEIMDGHAMHDDCTTALRVLKENGFEVPEGGYSRRKAAATAARDRFSRKDNIRRIIIAIESNEWDRGLERYVTSDPEVLLDDRITKAIEDNDTITSRQLRRRAERIPRDQDPDLYDF